MKIVVLDGQTLNPGDLSWQELGAIGELTVYPRTPENQILERARSAQVVLTNKTPLNASTIHLLPDLRYIGVLATGCNVIDLQAAAARGIPVCNAAGYSSTSVAQLVLAFVLHFANEVALHSAHTRSGGWAAAEDFSYCLTPQQELAGQTIGIIGLGAIGLQTARLAQAFGMHILAFTRHPERPAPEGIAWCSLEEIFRRSDFLSLHCPLTAETEHLVNEQRLSWMKPTAVLINTGRGALVNERALAKALDEGRLAGAAVDVLSTEPPTADNPLLHAPRCIVTPHIAWATRSSRSRLMRQTVENLRAFLEGNPRNVVN